jgi:hypothetical protein
MLPFEDFPMLGLQSTRAANLTTTWNTTFSTSTFHSAYHPLPEIRDFISDLANDHPDLIELISIGHSAEQQEMTALKISDKRPALSEKSGAPMRPKGGVVIVGAQHAREVWAPRGYLGHAHLLIPSLPLSGLQPPHLCISLMGSSRSPRNITR